MTLSPPPRRVLHIITRLIVGGAQENTLYTADLMDKSQFEVSVISGPQTGSEGSLIEEARQRDISLVILPSLLRQISPWNDFRALFFLRQFITAGHFEIVHTHSSKAGILGRLAAIMAGVPVVVHTIHGWSFHPYMPFFTRVFYIFLERWIASLSNALIVVTERDRDKGLRAGIGRADQYHLIRSAIPLQDFDPSLYDRRAVRRELGIPDTALVIGNIGRFSPQKNPIAWVRVARAVSLALPDTRFILVGDGPLRSEVQAELEKLGLLDHTLLTGLRRDVPRLMAAMDIFLLTSLWEGLPRVIPQALAMRLPIVANRADGTAEAIQDGVTGFLCEPGNLQQTVERCLLLAHNPLLRQEMGARGRKYACSEFDLNQMIHQIQSLYNLLISQKGIN